MYKLISLTAEAYELPNEKGRVTDMAITKRTHHSRHHKATTVLMSMLFPFVTSLSPALRIPYILREYMCMCLIRMHVLTSVFNEHVHNEHLGMQLYADKKHSVLQDDH